MKNLSHLPRPACNVHHIWISLTEKEKLKVLSELVWTGGDKPLIPSRNHWVNAIFSNPMNTHWRRLAEKWHPILRKAFRKHMLAKDMKAWINDRQLLHREQKKRGKKKRAA
jgi:hypothetical protein